MLSHKFNNCLLSLGGGGVLPYMASMGMCHWTGYGFCPLCAEQGYIVWHKSVLNRVCNFLQVCPKHNLVPRVLFPGFGGGAGKGPGIGRSIRHFDWLIDLGNLCKKMTK